MLRQRLTRRVTGKLDDDTRASQEFQEAEGLKGTGTLNRVTLEKMSIELTAKQKAMISTEVRISAGTDGSTTSKARGPASIQETQAAPLAHGRLSIGL